MTTTGLADQLSTMLGRPVINETGIKGTFDICLQWAGGQAPAALRDRLGLELEASKCQPSVASGIFWEAQVDHCWGDLTMFRLA